MPIADLMDPYHVTVTYAQIAAMAIAIASVVAASLIILRSRRRSKGNTLTVFMSVGGAVLASIAALAGATMQVAPVMDSTTTAVAEQASSSYGIQVPVSAVRSAWTSKGDPVKFTAERNGETREFLVSIAGNEGAETLQLALPSK